MKRDVSYSKAIVICHGKSEKQMCEFIRNNLRLNIIIESDKNGEKSIQITSLLKFLNNRKYKTEKDFMNFFGGKIGKLNRNFKIFIIMDTDDCTEKQKSDFINKKMFKNHWAEKYIVPIFNSKNLEDVLIRAKIRFEKRGKKMKGEYVKIFPTDSKYIKSDTIQINDFRENLKDCKNTNLNEFIDFCLSIG